jgi:hypothetical protein
MNFVEPSKYQMQKLTTTTVYSSSKVMAISLANIFRLIFFLDPASVLHVLLEI